MNNAITLTSLHIHVSIAREVSTHGTFSDAPRNAPLYAEHVRRGTVTLSREDRGDGIERIQIKATNKFAPLPANFAAAQLDQLLTEHRAKYPHSRPIYNTNYTVFCLSLRGILYMYSLNPASDTWKLISANYLS